MSFLLDTNVVSEWAKPRPNTNVVRWLAQIDEDSAYLSVITFAEIGHGIAGMASGRRKDALKSWLENDLYFRFERRILSVDFAIAAAWGVLMGQRRKTGVSFNPMDAFLAATAEVHALTLATRNTTHFAKIGVPLVNPWMATKEDAAS